MRLISTHNSATGERSLNFFHALTRPVSRCQGKTLYEQYRAGCTYFDIRTRRDRRGTFRAAHGLWLSRRTAESILAELSMYATDLRRRTGRSLYVAIGLERGAHDVLRELQTLVRSGHYAFTVAYWDTKDGGWHIEETEADVPLRAAFDDLNLSLLSWQKPATWRVLLPIPRLWARLRRPRPSFDEATFTQVDFL